MAKTNILNMRHEMKWKDCDDTWRDDANDVLTQALVNIFNIDRDNVDHLELVPMFAQLFEVEEAPQLWSEVSKEQYDRIKQYAGPHGYTIWKARQAQKTA